MRKENLVSLRTTRISEVTLTNDAKLTKSTIKESTVMNQHRDEARSREVAVDG